MRIITIIFTVFIVILGVSFAVLNAELVTINYYIGTRSLPLSLLVILCFSLGLLFGLLICSVVYMKLKRKVWQLRSRIKLIEKEVGNLRAIPLKDRDIPLALKK